MPVDQTQPAADGDLKYWLGFNLVSGIGPARFQTLLAYFGTLGDAWRASEQQLREVGLDSRALEKLREARASVDLDVYARKVSESGARVLTLLDEDYPATLREIPAAPPVIFVRGQLEPVDEWAVAIVGTRRLSAYGRQVARELAAGLARTGITIVSGLARGIDAIAHKTALDEGGRSIGVLACGIDRMYPPEHRELARQMVDGRGAVISDYPLGAKPESQHFPARNRLISGLSLGTVVVEAAERSGALITARFANEQDREVFAVPGNINSRTSQGTNTLIQQGAKLIMRVEDILEELNLRMVAERAAVQTVLPATAEEAALLVHLSGAQPVHVDELSRAIGWPSATVSSTLTMMELRGLVQQVGGMNYIRLREIEAEYRVDSQGD